MRSEKLETGDYMPRSTRTIPIQKRSEETIDRILSSSAHLLLQVGYRDMSTNQIAEHAHLSIGTIYRYFNDKAEIVVALREKSEADIMGRLVEAVTTAGTLGPEEAIRHVLSSLVDALESHRGVITAVVHELPMGIQSNVLPSIERQLHHIARFALLQRKPDLSAMEVDAMIYLGMGLVLNAALRIAVDRPAHLSKEFLIDNIVAIAGARVPF